MREVVRDELGPGPTLTRMEVDSGRGLSHHLLEEEKKGGGGSETLNLYKLKKNERRALWTEKVRKACCEDHGQ